MDRIDQKRILLRASRPCPHLPPIMRAVVSRVACMRLLDRSTPRDHAERATFINRDGGGDPLNLTRPCSRDTTLLYHLYSTRIIFNP
jgi:hypothetical protein